MTTTPQEPGSPLEDSDLETVTGSTPQPAPGDADGTDADTSDTTDGDATEGDSDSTDSTDGTDSDATDG